MLSVVQRTLAVMSPKYVRRVAFLLVALLGSSIIDAVAFGLLYPFIQLLTNPSPKYHSTALRLTSNVLGTSVRHTLEVRLGLLILFLFILSSVVGIVLTYVQSRVVAGSEADTSIRLFTGYLQAPYADHLDRNSSELVRNVQTAVDDIHQLVLTSLLIIAGNLMKVLIIAFVMILITPVVTAVVFLYFCFVSLLYMKVVSPRAQAAGATYLARTGDVIRISQEGFGGIKSLQAHDALQPINQEFARTKWSFARARTSMSYYAMLPQYYLQSALIAGMVLFGLVTYFTHTKNVVALIGLLMAASVSVLPALYTTLSSLNRIHNGEASLDHIKGDLEHYEPKEPEPVAAAPAPADPIPEFELRDRIALVDVSFCYPHTTTAVVDHVSMTIPRGKSVALVGQSGVGKTTVVDLLLGLFPVTSGHIEIDGIVLDDTNMTRWRHRVGYVPQEVFLLDGSVKDNIRFRRVGPDPDPADLWSALERAQIADFVAALPDGIQTVVGERGVRLSGGQRQRLGIARALYRNPEVLILDEATSALDTATEAAVAETISSLKGTLTMVIIAHRLSTVRDCDSLVLMADGQIIAQGDFETLRRENTLFSELARLSHIEVGQI